MYIYFFFNLFLFKAVRIHLGSKLVPFWLSLDPFWLWSETIWAQSLFHVGSKLVPRVLFRRANFFTHVRPPLRERNPCIFSGNPRKTVGTYRGEKIQKATNSEIRNPKFKFEFMDSVIPKCKFEIPKLKNQNHEFQN